MRYETIEKLCCPFDKADLNLRAITVAEENVIEGVLICQKCNKIYLIVSGIPIMNPDEYRDFKLEQAMMDKWNTYFQEKGEAPLLIMEDTEKCTNELA